MDYHLRAREDGKYDVIEGLLEGQGRVITTVETLDGINPDGLADESSAYAQEGMDMPWELVGRGNQTCVVKKGENVPLKCYDNRADAEAYMRALYVNTKGESMSMTSDGTETFGMSDEEIGEELHKAGDQRNAFQRLLDAIFRSGTVKWSADNQLGNWMDLHAASCRIGGWDWHPHEQSQASMAINNILGDQYAVGTPANANLVQALSGYRWNVGDDPVASLTQHLDEWAIKNPIGPPSGSGGRPPTGSPDGPGRPPTDPVGGIPLPDPRKLKPGEGEELARRVDELGETPFAVKLLAGWQWGAPFAQFGVEGEEGDAAEKVGKIVEEKLGGGLVNKILNAFFRLGQQWSAGNPLNNWMDLHCAGCRVGGWDWHPNEQAQASMLLPNILGANYAIGTPANANLVQALSGYKWNASDDPVQSLAQHLSDWALRNPVPSGQGPYPVPYDPGGSTRPPQPPTRPPTPGSGGGGLWPPGTNPIDQRIESLEKELEGDDPIGLAVKILAGWQWGLPIPSGLKW